MEATKNAAKSSSGSLVSSRGDARISIGEKWANRRKLQKNQHHGQLDDDSSAIPILRNSRASLSSHDGTFSIPPLCVLLRRSWNQTINGLIQHQQNNNSDDNHYKTQTAERASSLQQKKSVSNSPRSSTRRKDENNMRISFPSVLSVLKANAVKLQVETIMLAEENERNEYDNNGGTHDGYGRSNDSGLSVLPANCNDFTTSAVNHMSDSRSRAFLLLDFSAIVQTYTVWRKRLAIPKNQKEVQMVYSARHNCNARLLQLLQRLGIGLRVATKYDLAAVREATHDNHNDNNAIIWDDSSILVKPNSFYRNLLLNRNREDNEDEGLKTTTRTVPITVSNAEEMQRIHKQLQNICQRRRQRQNDMPNLDFILKLDSDINDFEQWKTSLRNVHEKALKLSNTRVVGVALDLGGKDEKKANNEDADDTGNIHVLLLDALSYLIKNWVDELAVSKNLSTNTTTIATKLRRQPPQVHLTNPITSTEIEIGVIAWIEKHRKICNGITIDVSRLLMANAAALCARIIGVKNNESNDKKYGGTDNSNICSNKKNITDNNNNEKIDDNRDDYGDVATNLIDDIQQQQEKDANAIQQHLYIDDGCYGSLSNYPNEGIPVPLKSQRLVRSLSATSKQLLESEQKTLVNTTVWGPTCDGLDKVCANIALPRLSRDDWLVFTDLGFCHEGTCFNGFLPPDIACCVLGGNP